MQATLHIWGYLSHDTANALAGNWIGGYIKYYLVWEDVQTIQFFSKKEGN